MTDCPRVRVLIATNNAAKHREISEILAGTVFEVVALKQAGIVATVEETGETFEDNAVIKATTYLAMSGLPAIADDSGIAVDALEGRPGVYSARFGGDIDDDGRNALLIEMLTGVPDEKRTARYVCAITIALPNGIVKTFEETCEGRVGYTPIGNGGFGYDPIFLPVGETRTMAELTADEKHAISHRGKALRLALDWLTSLPAEALR